MAAAIAARAKNENTKKQNFRCSAHCLRIWEDCFSGGFLTETDTTFFFGRMVRERGVLTGFDSTGDEEIGVAVLEVHVADIPPSFIYDGSSLSGWQVRFIAGVERHWRSCLWISDPIESSRG